MNIKGHNHKVNHHVGYLECDACDDRSPSDGVHCDECEFTVHEKCCFVFTVLMTVKHPSHVGHRLKLLTKGDPDHTDPKCHICGKNTKRLLFHCYSCKLNLDIDCMVDDNTITHFAHEHNLNPNKENDIALEESILCEACVRPIGSSTFYNCSNCSFFLHETCANLPKKKRHFLSPRPLTLHLKENNTESTCSACLQLCCKGFMYTDGDKSFDLMCCSITVPLNHGSHPHPLLYYEVSTEEGLGCVNCTYDAYQIALGCIKCNYFLDFRCATMPLTVRLDRYDDHPLSLCYGEKPSGKYWCDICERETNPEAWFYTCNDCGVTLHVFCVLGNVKYAKQGSKIDDDVDLMFNKRSSRPLCSICHYRCPTPFYFIKENEVFCSYYCLMRIQITSTLLHFIRCPPWIEVRLKKPLL